MVNETSGLICVSLEASRCEELELPQMVKQNTESHQTAFTVSVDYKQGTSTGYDCGPFWRQELIVLFSNAISLQTNHLVLGACFV